MSEFGYSLLSIFVPLIMLPWLRQNDRPAIPLFIVLLAAALGILVIYQLLPHPFGLLDGLSIYLSGGK